MASTRVHQTGEPGAPWCIGWAQYFIDRIVSSGCLPVAIRCRFPVLENVELALLDTAATWSLIGGEVAELLKPHAEDTKCPITLDTRFGDMVGNLHLLDVELVADEGESLLVRAPVLLAPEWTGPFVVGYHGLLEHVRLGLDPGVGGDDQWFCFGSSDQAEP